MLIVLVRQLPLSLKVNTRLRSHSTFLNEAQLYFLRCPENRP